jgi:hypothetical protein
LLQTVSFYPFLLHGDQQDTSSPSQLASDQNVSSHCLLELHGGTGPTIGYLKQPYRVIPEFSPYAKWKDHQYTPYPPAHRHIWIYINMVKPIHGFLYPLHFGLTFLTLFSISIFILLAWSNQCKVFLNLCPYKQTKVETVTAKIRTSDKRPELLTFAGFNCKQCPLLFDLCLVCPHLCTLDSFSNLWSRLVHCPTLLVHAKQATIETNSKSSTHLPFAKSACFHMMLWYSTT